MEENIQEGLEEERSEEQEEVFIGEMSYRVDTRVFSNLLDIVQSMCEEVPFEFTPESWNLKIVDSAESILSGSRFTTAHQIDAPEPSGRYPAGCDSANIVKSAILDKMSNFALMTISCPHSVGDNFYVLEGVERTLHTEEDLQG